MDIDLLGGIDNSLDGSVAAMKDVCRMNVVEDGMAFDAQSVTASRSTEDAQHQGVRVRVRGNLGNARVSLQIDIGFGDVVVPRSRKVVYPVLLNHPAPEMKGYTKESTISEKFQTMVKLGVLNSRMKDFYDIWMLCYEFDFAGEMLAEAVQRTFENRDTPISADPAIFHLAFAEGRST